MARERHGGEIGVVNERGIVTRGAYHRERHGDERGIVTTEETRRLKSINRVVKRWYNRDSGPGAEVQTTIYDVQFKISAQQDAEVQPDSLFQRSVF